MSSISQIYLAYGDQNLNGAVNLLETDNPTGGAIMLANAWSAPPPQEPSESQTGTAQTNERVITIKDLLIFGTFPAQMWATWARIQELLTAAPQRARAQTMGPWVTLWVKFLNDANFKYFDVKWGILKDNNVDSGNSLVRHATLDLHCLPYARGPVIQLATSSTISDGAAPQYFVPQEITSDAGALCQVLVNDVSTGGQAINRIRIRTKHAIGMQSSDFTMGGLATVTLPTQYQLWIPTASTTFTLTFGGQTTGTLGNGTIRPTQAQVQTALQGLSSIGAGNLIVSGGNGTNSIDPMLLTFAGTKASAEQGAIVSTPGGTSVYVVASTSHYTTDATGLVSPGGVIRASLTAGFTPAANFAQPSGSLTKGLGDFVLRVRDNTLGTYAPGAATTPVTTAFSDSHAGTLPADYYTVWSTTSDASGYESPPGPKYNAGYISSGSMYVAVYYSIVPTTITVYYSALNGGFTRYHSFGSGFGATASAFLINTNTDPSAPINTLVPNNAQFVGLIGMAATSPSYVVGEVIASKLGNGQWEHLYIGTMNAPPKVTAEAETTPLWTLQVQARTPVPGAFPSADFDACYFLPHDSEEDSIDARVGGFGLTTPGKWLIDTDRQLRPSAELQTSGGTISGQASVIGRLRLKQGNNLLLFLFDGTGGLSDAVNLKATVTLRLTPLYRNVGGY